MGFRRKQTDASARATPVEKSDDPLVKQAIKFAKKNGISTSPLDVESLAEALGADIKRPNNLGDKILGRVDIDQKNPEKCTIRINPKYNNHALKFTLAHELGHFLKQKKWESCEIGADDLPAALQYYRSSQQGGIEWIANSFAAQLLMPEDAVKALVDQGSSEDDIARSLEVSKSALDIRLRELGYK